MPISSQVKPLGRRKIGLALSSGVARGWAHIGAWGDWELILTF
jgi:NTE family protein